MADIDSQLDNHILNMFDTLEKLFATQTDLEQVMKDGFFNISRARYSLGVKRVSADMILEADMQAKHTVTLSDEIVRGANDGIDNLDPKPKMKGQDKRQMFTLQSTNSNVPESLQSVLKNTSPDSPSSGLRKRVIKRSNGSDDPDNSNADESKDTKKMDPKELTMADSSSDLKDEDNIEVDKAKEEKERPKPFNPLHLFGVLVPRELRISQQKFEAAVALAVEVCNLQEKLQMQQKKYQQVKEQHASDE